MNKPFKRLLLNAVAILSISTLSGCVNLPSQNDNLKWVDASTKETLTSTNGDYVFSGQHIKAQTSDAGRLYLDISAPQCNNANRVMQVNINNQQFWTVSIPSIRKELVIGNKISGDNNSITLSSDNSSNCPQISIHGAKVKNDGGQLATLDMNPFVNYPPAYNSVFLDKVARAKVETANDPRSQNLGLLNQPAAVWLGVWTPKDLANQIIKQNIAQGYASGRTPVFVIYGIRGVDCSKNYETGYKEQEYQDWINSIASSLGNSNSVLIYEPDALPFANDPNCKSPQGNRIEIMKKAIDTLAVTQSTIYIDAGNSNWLSVDDMKNRLMSVGIDKVRGFSLNISNTYTTEHVKNFGDKLSKELGGKGYVVDTSRNGNGPYDGDDMAWCNPPGRRIGENPTPIDREGNLDALLWIKNPGESDELCRGGPKAGEFWNEYALGLVSN